MFWNFRKKEALAILQASVSNPAQSFLDLFLQSKHLAEDNIFYSQLQTSYSGQEFASTDHNLIIELKDFQISMVLLEKNLQSANWTPSVWTSLLAADDDIIHVKKFMLIATISYSRNLNSSHHRAYIKNK